MDPIANHMAAKNEEKQEGLDKWYIHDGHFVRNLTKDDCSCAYCDQGAALRVSSA